jgi:hypothetical protein
MAGWRRAVELAKIERLTTLSRSRTEPASRVSRAQMLLAYFPGAFRTTRRRYLQDTRILVSPIAVTQQALVELARRQPRQLGLKIY